MIRSAFQHLPGIGPQRLALLRDAGIRDWDELIEQSGALLGMKDGQWQRVVAAVEECRRAFTSQDLSFLTEALHTSDHWRILAKYFDRATFFDIETTGLDCDSQITIIACYHNGEFYRFFKDENLEDFLDLLEEVELLVSFNGNSFDVPKIERTFHIPGLPCPHLDLRWVCHHAGLRGGLKKIEPRLGVFRPPDLAFVDGAEAVWLWEEWEQTADPHLRTRLERYCCADVAALHLVGAEILRQAEIQVASKTTDEIWHELDTVAPPHPAGNRSGGSRSSASLTAVDTASPEPLADLASAEERLRHMLRRKRMG